MLTQHPNVSISSEGAYIAYLRQHVPRDGGLASSESLEAVHKNVLSFLERERFVSLPPYSELVVWVQRWGANLSSLITFYGTWEAAALGKRFLSWWGDNAPYHALHIPFFSRLFPLSKFVVVIRDPRDVYASHKSSFVRHSIESMVSEWEEVLLAGLMARQSLGASRVLELQYENLVLAPEKELERISVFLNIEPSSRMLSYYESESARAVGQLSHHVNVMKPLFSDSIGRANRVLQPCEICTIEERLYTPMRYLGYLSESAYDQIGQALLQKRVRGG
jgi:hypothetical protein